VFLSLMAQPWAVGANAPYVPNYYVAVAAVAALICVLQRVSVSIEGFRWESLAGKYAFVSNSLLSVLFLAALAKGLADPFKPFIYFRF
jgi:alginate O-acetyltransferase complex protein AlgI